MNTSGAYQNYNRGNIYYQHTNCHLQVMVEGMIDNMARETEVAEEDINKDKIKLEEFNLKWDHSNLNLEDKAEEGIEEMILIKTDMIDLIKDLNTMIGDQSIHLDQSNHKEMIE